MIYCDRIELSEAIDLTKSSNSTECIICHYWLFNHGLKFQNSVWNGGHDLTFFCLNLCDFAIITVKNVHYHYITHNISKSEAINSLKHSVLENPWYI